MKKTLFLLTLLACISVSAQDIFGKWKTIDDETGEAKSIVEIYEQDGKVYGKILEILNPEKKEALCTKCEDNEKNKPILGLVIIKDMQEDGEYYKKGTIFDPQRGKKYKCRIKIHNGDPNLLQVRGYLGFIYATQYWERVVD